MCMPAPERRLLHKLHSCRHKLRQGPQVASTAVAAACFGAWALLRQLSLTLVALACCAIRLKQLRDKLARQQQEQAAGPVALKRVPRAIRFTGYATQPDGRSLPLLLPRTPRLQQRLTVVLDLDETLVCTYRAAAVPARLRQADVRAHTSCFELTCELGQGMLSRVQVFCRPGVTQFLHSLSRFADLVLFTAGMPSYAAPVADRLDPARDLFAARLYRAATTAHAGRPHVKDLARLGRDLARTVIVDNNPFSFMLQPLNGVPVPSFRGDPSDRDLLESVLPLLERLDAADDVRPLLSEQFDMAAWFDARGVDTTDF